MPLIKRHNRMMMELLSPCYVNQEATQHKMWSGENRKMYNLLILLLFLLLLLLLLPLRVVNRQGISREWPPRIGARKKQNVAERMNTICNWIVDHKHYSHYQAMYEVLNWPFYTASEFLNSFAWLQLQLQWPSIQPSTYNLKSTATPFLDALDVGEWVKQSVTNSFFRDFSFKIRMNYVSSYLRSSPF